VRFVGAHGMQPHDATLSITRKRGLQYVTTMRAAALLPSTPLEDNRDEAEREQHDFWSARRGAMRE
jgi:hypothetical protein